MTIYYSELYRVRSFKDLKRCRAYRRQKKFILFKFQGKMCLMGLWPFNFRDTMDFTDAQQCARYLDRMLYKYKRFGIPHEGITNPKSRGTHSWATGGMVCR